MKEYTIIVKGKRIPVTYDIYKAYYQEYEHSLEQFIGTGVRSKNHPWHLF